MEGILVPVKNLSKALTRLGGNGNVSVEDRRELALAMLTDVLTAASGWTKKYLVTEDEDARQLGEAQGWEPIRDPGGGLNQAIEAGTARALETGTTKLLVVPADVVLVSQESLARVFACAAQVVIVPSDDGGTAGLLRRPPAAIPPRFGPASSASHIKAAESSGLVFEILNEPSMSLDVDDIDDLRRLALSSEERMSTRAAARIVSQLDGRA